MEEELKYITLSYDNVRKTVEFSKEQLEYYTNKYRSTYNEFYKNEYKKQMDMWKTTYEIWKGILDNG